MSELLEAVDVYKEYNVGGREVWALNGASLKVQRGAVTVVLGASGAGKSTLLHVLGMLDSPTRGEVLLEGRPTTALQDIERARTRNRIFGFVFQFYHLLPELNALENVLLPRMIQEGPSSWRRKKKEFIQRAELLLERVGLLERMKHRPAQLSGGERQRVAVARALMNSPGILLCDEPTGNLDSRSGEAVRDLIWRLRDESGLTVVVVTHDERLAKLADRVEVIVDGRIRRS